MVVKERQRLYKIIKIAVISLSIAILLCILLVVYLLSHGGPNSLDSRIREMEQAYDEIQPILRDYVFEHYELFMNCADLFKSLTNNEQLVYGSASGSFVLYYGVNNREVLYDLESGRMSEDERFEPYYGLLDSPKSLIGSIENYEGEIRFRIDPQRYPHSSFAAIYIIYSEDKNLADIWLSDDWSMTERIDDNWFVGYATYNVI